MKVCKPIGCEDLRAGMYVTVLRGRPLTEAEKENINGLCGVTTAVNTKTHDSSWQGDVIRVLSVCAPYFVGVVESCWPLTPRPKTFDTRELHLGRISQQYAKAATRKDEP